jgi:hypothetical protein
MGPSIRDQLPGTIEGIVEAAFKVAIAVKAKQT